MKKILVTKQQLESLEKHLKKNKVLNESIDVNGFKIPKNILSTIVEEVYKTTKTVLSENSHKENLREQFEDYKNGLIAEGYSKKVVNELNFDSLYGKIKQREMDESLVGISGNDKTYGNNKKVKQIYTVIGSIFGNPIDVLTKTIEKKVEYGEIDNIEGKRVFDIIAPDVNNKKIKKEDIEQAVEFTINKYIKNLN